MGPTIEHQAAEAMAQLLQAGVGQQTIGREWPDLPLQRLVRPRIPTETFRQPGTVRSGLPTIDERYAWVSCALM